jgi:hypothetical protein
LVSAIFPEAVVGPADPKIVWLSRNVAIYYRPDSVLKTTGPLHNPKHARKNLLKKTFGVPMVFL